MKFFISVLICLFCAACPIRRPDTVDGLEAYISRFEQRIQIIDRFPEPFREIVREYVRIQLSTARTRLNEYRGSPNVGPVTPPE